MTSEVSVRDVDVSHLRQMSAVARLYYVQGVRQREIGERLSISQARVSRLLRQAQARGIVRTHVMVPEGLHPEMEETLERRYGLAEAHVVDFSGEDEALPSALGGAAARYLAGATLAGSVIGFTSWSTTLQEMAVACEGLLPRAGTTHVVEMLGDLGSPLLQHAAARATQRLASALGAEPVYLRTPGVVPTPAVRSAALGDAHVRRALRLLDEVDVAFVGVGPPDLHGALRAGDSYFTADQLRELRMLGAAGQLNQRFIDERGLPVLTPYDDLVIGATLQQLRGADRRVVVAGGVGKRAAIAAALAGRWVDVLMTDVRTARWLASQRATR